MPSEKNNIASDNRTFDTISSSPLRGKGVKHIQNHHCSLFYIGKPLWHIGGLKLEPNTPESFDQITQLYLKDKSLFLNCLSGHFAIQITDLASFNSLAASDRIGVHRLYWTQAPDQKLLISTSLAELKSTTDLLPNSIYCYMYFHMIPTPFSIYSGIEKLAPGQSLLFENGNIKIEQYWLPEFEDITNKSIQSLSGDLHMILEESVKDCIGEEPSYATFLSGGLDSSTVTGVASKVGTKNTHSYSIGFDAKEYDETPFARLTAKHFSSQHHEYFVTPEDVVNAVPKIAAAYDEPFGNSSAVPTYYCAKAAADNGVNLMLAGDGGDELFAGNTRYASQRYYQYYLALPKALRKGLFDHIINSLPRGVPLATKAQNYIRQAEVPLPDRLQVYNFLHRHDPLDIFDKDYLELVDIEMPLRMQREQFSRPKSTTDLNRMLYLDWQFTLADNDLRKVGNMCDLAGINVAYPLLTDELINFSCKVPSSLKLYKNNLRYFFKFAMQEFLPQATLNKSKHGFGLPFGVWLKDYKPLHELANDSLEKLKTRHYFNASFIDKVRKMHGNTHAGYYGELIWVMMMLELWIDNHQIKH